MRGLVTLCLLAISGCGTMPTEPMLDSNPTASVPMAAMTPAQPEATSSQETQAVEVDGVQAVAMVDGSAGGTLRAGNVSVRIPKNAFTGSAEVTVKLLSASRSQVQLEIEPASKNSFSQPVILEYDMRALGRDARTMKIVWFDPAVGRWVEIPYFADASGKVSAPLAHFSLYDCVTDVVGRAGW